MKTRLALKRLSSSDLTFFEHHYNNTSGAKQKAFNLDTAIFIDSFYPGLPNRLDGNKSRIPPGLSIYGPGKAGLHSLQRKILKQQKNWRLNGELIHDPPEEKNRYDKMQKGDFAIIDFLGDPEPHTARIYFISRSFSTDEQLHAALEAKYSSDFSSRKGMVLINPEELARLVTVPNFPQGHPILDLLDYDALEDAAQGGIEGIEKLKKRRRSRGVSHEELIKAKKGAEQIGRLGEELLYEWLKARKIKGFIHDFRWESDTNAVAPYDFILLENGSESRRIDAKSTMGDFTNPIHVSIAELYEMAQCNTPYDLYRLYSLKETSARMRIALDMHEFAVKLFNNFTGLPKGVTVDGVSIRPENLNFDKEIFINLDIIDEENEE